MSEEEYNENLDNPGDYNSKSDFSKAEIVRQQVSKVSDCRSKEMREGYYNFDKMGNRIYVPDTRKEFISSVKALRTLLEPETKKDKKFKEAEEKILKRIVQAIKTYGIYKHNQKGNKVEIDTSKPKYIPHLGEIFPMEKVLTHKGMLTGQIVELVPGVFDRNHHEYWNYLVECYDELSSQLSNLIDRIKYFKEEISY